MTEEFIAKAKEVKPIALIAEGTRIKDKSTNESEQIVYSQSDKLTANSKNLVFADFNFKDVDRVQTFYNIAKNNGRKLVIKIKDAYFLKHLSSDPNLNLPNWDDEHIAIYKAKYRSGTYSDSDYFGEDRVFATAPNALTAAEIASKPDKYICAIGFFSFNALIDMKPQAGAIYIHSSSEAYNEEQVLSTKRLKNWIDRFQMEHHQIHCSGHAKGEDLMEMVQDIDSKILFPVHTEYPTEYARVTNKINVVELNKKYEI